MWRLNLGLVIRLELKSFGNEGTIWLERENGERKKLLEKLDGLVLEATTDNGGSGLELTMGSNLWVWREKLQREALV